MNVPYPEPYWGQHATVYDEGVDYVVGRSLRLAVAARLSRERRLGQLLECGCGTGFYTKVALRHADRVMATDISGRMLEIARHELASSPKACFLKASAEVMPFPARTFDAILIANVLQTVRDPMSVLHECFRTLKYDGLLIAIVYTDYAMDSWEITDLSLRYFQKFGMPPPWGLRNFTPAELRGLAGQAGFRVKSVAILGDQPKALYLRSVKSVLMDRAPVR